MDGLCWNISDRAVSARIFKGLPHDPVLSCSCFLPSSFFLFFLFPQCLYPMATRAPGMSSCCLLEVFLIFWYLAIRASIAVAKKQTRSAMAKVVQPIAKPKPKAKATRGRAAAIPPLSSSPGSSPSSPQALTVSEVKALQALSKKKKDVERQVEAARVRSGFFFCYYSFNF